MELPKVFANPIEKDFKNTQKIYEGDIKDRTLEKQIPLQQKINNIFFAKDFIYKKKVIITTIDGKKEKIIVGKTKDTLLTMNGEKIKINDIYDIEII